MTILLLRGYNNYFNRIVKKENTISAYKTASTSYLEYPNVNFDPQDGVVTELVVGSEVQMKETAPATPGTEPTKEVLKFDSLGCPDYLVVHDNTNIASRWFVLECLKVRQGQFKLALKRDVLADFRDDILNAPCFVEKGFINDTKNPLLFNSENMSYNQIKQDEVPLIDESGSAWLVGYIKKSEPQWQESGVMARDLGDSYDVATLSFKDYIDYDDDSATPNTLIVPSAVTTKFNIALGGTTGQILHLNADITDINNASYTYLGFDSSMTWQGLNSFLLGTPTASRVPDTMGNYYAGRFTSNANSITPSATRTGYKNFISNSVKTANTLTEVSTITDSDYTSIISTYNNALVIKNGATYKLNVYLETTTRTAFTYLDYQSNSIVGTYIDYLKTDVSSSLTKNETSSAMNKLRGEIVYNKLIIQAIKQDVSGDAITITIPAAGTNRYITEDALYDIIAVPFIPAQYRGSKTAKFKDSNGTTRTVDSEAMLFIMQYLMQKMDMGNTEAGHAYDLQLLPYCPIKMPTNNDLRSLDTKSYSIITKAPNDTPIGYVLFPSSANFTKDLDLRLKAEHEADSIQTIVNPVFTYYGNEDDYDWYSCPFPYIVTDAYDSDYVDFTEIPSDLPSDTMFGMGLSFSAGYAPWAYFGIPQNPNNRSAITLTGNLSLRAHWVVPDGPLDLKVRNECDFLRFTSPNWNSMFECKLSKFDDGISLLNVDCTYKPISPYIKLNPNFSFLYGRDFNDSTGLILSGDFSLPVMNDPWINYQLSHKNYQAAFNRQIQNLDVNNSIALEQQKFQGDIGTLTGAVAGAGAGAYAGFKAGGGIGAGVGALVGGSAGAALTAIGAGKDRDWLMRAQAETKSYTTDMYNYQLGNIKALPQSISKSDPLTYNNKIWPILEKFSCTDTEKNVLKDKIQYNGMTVMAIGSLSQYMYSNDFDKVYVKGQLIRLENIDDDFHIVDAIYQEVNKGFYMPQGE